MLLMSIRGFDMIKNLYFYSINSFLAFKINETYYHDLHYVWVAPYFNTLENPISSNPCDIFHNVHNSVNSKDSHSDYIERNKTGILNGAEHKLKTGIITRKQRDEIAGIIKVAEKVDFKPLLYIIIASKVSKMLIEPAPSEKAYSFSKEYKILELPRKFFDIIEIKL